MDSARSQGEVWLHRAILRGARVLVLEDESLIALDIEQVCRDFGAGDVVVARTVDGAEGEALAGAFDIVVLDLMLAGHSTVGFASRLSARGIPFVFTTGYSDVEPMLGDLAGAQVVEKPFLTETLVTAIAAALERG